MATPLADRLTTPAGRAGVLAARVVVAAVFVAAAVPKLLEPGTFAIAIDNYRLLPAGAVGPTAVLVPVLELAVAAALVVGAGARGAGVVGAALLAVFTVGIVQALARGIDIECGCFGSATRAQADWTSVARNVALIAGCVFVSVAPDTPWRRPAAADVAA